MPPDAPSASVHGTSDRRLPTGPAGYPDPVFGINGGELLVLFLVAAFVIGPERLPKYAEQLGLWVRRARQFASDAKARVDEELGEEARDVDWAALDPRKYDPRRIVREALLDDLPPAAGRPPAPSGPGPSLRKNATAAGTAAGAATAAAAGASASRSTATATVAGSPGDRWRTAPFDDEAT